MAWWERAKVGDKITPIVDRIASAEGDILALEPGQILTITRVLLSSRHRSEAGCRVFFAIAELAQGWGYAADHFKPVKTTETGMAILRGLLDQAPAHRAAQHGDPASNEPCEALTGGADQ